MYSYLFTDQADNKPTETFIGEQPAGFITFGDGDPVDWTKFDHVNGELVAIPEPEPVEIPVPYMPTADELKQQANSEIKWQIQQIEATQARAVRECALGMEGATERLQAIENSIVALRAQLQV
jgi:hypothetical protein